MADDIYMEGLVDLARLGSYLVEHWTEGACSDVDGGELFDWLKASGVIAEIPGGFNSEKHEAGNFDPEEGDEWFEATKPVQAALRFLDRNPPQTEREE